MLPGKGAIRVRVGVVRTDDDVFGSKQNFFSPHPLTNFEKNLLPNKPKFKGVYWQNNLPKTMRNGPYIINHDE